MLLLFIVLLSNSVDLSCSKTTESDRHVNLFLNTSFLSTSRSPLLDAESDESNLLQYLMYVRDNSLISWPRKTKQVSIEYKSEISYSTLFEDFIVANRFVNIVRQC